MSEKLGSEKASKYATVDDSLDRNGLFCGRRSIKSGERNLSLELGEMKRLLRTMYDKVREPYPPAIVKSSGFVGRRTIW